MFEITVRRLDGKEARDQASHAQILLDHIYASADRLGFTIYRDRAESYLLGYEVGDVLKDGAVVASWELGEIQA